MSGHLQPCPPPEANDQRVLARRAAAEAAAAEATAAETTTPPDTTITEPAQ
jgi:hypothetical protein